MNNRSVHFDLTNKKVFVAGHTGMAGSAIVRRLKTEACSILTVDHRELDLTRQEPTERYLASRRPDVVVMAAGRVGGIVANNAFPVEFLAENLAMELHLIRASYAVGVRRFLFLGSTCVYPKLAKQPMNEDQLLTGVLEPTNEWYAIAKIAGIKLCQAYHRQYGADFISVMPTNLFGPGDNYHPEHSHVVAALLRRFHEAKLASSPDVVVWGTGTPRREFLYVDDFADACVFILKHYSGSELINIGLGEDMSISDLARSIAHTVGYDGKILYDPSKPDGTPRKLVDVSRLKSLGWTARTSFENGLKETYADFVKRDAPSETGWAHRLR
jgi:GDP-L-fucose synthase